MPAFWHLKESVLGKKVFFFFFLIFWLDWVLVAVQAFPLLRREGVLSSRGPRASHRSGFFCCRAWALWFRGFSSCGSQAQGRGSGAGARGLSHSAACNFRKQTEQLDPRLWGSIYECLVVSPQERVSATANKTTKPVPKVRGPPTSPSSPGSSALLPPLGQNDCLHSKTRRRVFWLATPLCCSSERRRPLEFCPEPTRLLSRTLASTLCNFNYLLMGQRSGLPASP